ncbi:GNAT family N-acetyltransferase [Ancylomarina sp. YFZ004]
MEKGSIEKRCHFTTQRLSVIPWTNQITNLESENTFAKKVIEILTPNVTKALPDGWQNLKSINDAKVWINDRDQESHFVTVQLKATNETIGFIFLYESEPNQNYYDLRFGYLLSESVWGKGIGTELIEGLIMWCKDAGDIRSLSGGVECDNIGSIKVLEKTGFSISPKNSPSEQVVFYEYHFDINSKK